MINDKVYNNTIIIIINGGVGRTHIHIHKDLVCCCCLFTDNMARVIANKKHPWATNLWVYDTEQNGRVACIVSSLSPEDMVLDDRNVSTAYKIAWPGQIVEDCDQVNVVSIRGQTSTAMFVPINKALQHDIVDDATAPLFFPWPSITHLNNVSKTVRRDGLISRIIYRPKIKLHGTNAGVQIFKNSKGECNVLSQTRTRFATVDNDNCGFAAWVHKYEAVWATLPGSVVVFGEWVGPGVQKNDAICHIDQKHFCVFGVLGANQGSRRTEFTFDVHDTSGNWLCVDPTEIQILLGPVLRIIPAIKVIDWAGPEVEWVVDNPKPLEDVLSASVQAIGDRDPWVASVFGVDGPGEGLVMYPITVFMSDRHLKIVDGDMFHQARLMFKCKTENHGVKKMDKLVQAKTQTAGSMADLADMFVTEARCQQMADQVGGINDGNKNFKEFLTALITDIGKESKDERPDDYNDKQARQAITQLARKWWFK